MEGIKHIIDQVEQGCKSRGSRLTKKRKQVLAGLLQSEKALSAYELIDFCKAEFDAAMPPMSMYRILDFLQGERLVHKLNLNSKYVACSHITCDHDHAASQFLICDQCQKVKQITISKSTMSELNKNVKDAGYRLTSSQLEMNCICEDCAASTA